MLGELFPNVFSNNENNGTVLNTGGTPTKLLGNERNYIKAGAAYPVTSVGISIIYLCLVTTSLALGFINWAKGRQLNPHNEAPATIMAAFSGSIVLIVFILITAFAGIYIATGGF